MSAENEVHQADLLFLPYDTVKAGRINKRHLKYPKLLQADPGREFMGAVTKLMEKHSVKIRIGQAEKNRDQSVVERFNRTLAEKLFGYQYAKELEKSPQSQQRMG